MKDDKFRIDVNYEFEVIEPELVLSYKVEPVKDKKHLFSTKSGNSFFTSYVSSGAITSSFSG